MTAVGIVDPKVPKPQRLSPAVEAIVLNLRDAFHEARDAHDQCREAVRRFGDDRAEAWQSKRSRAAYEITRLQAALKVELLRESP